MNAIEKAAEAIVERINTRLAAVNSAFRLDTEIEGRLFAQDIKHELEKAVPAKETAMPTCGSGTRAWEKYEFARGHNECRKAFLGE